MVEKYGKKGFEVVGVTGEAAHDKTERFIAQTGMKAHVVYEPGLASMKAYGFGGFPSTALVNPKGKVVFKGHPSSLNDATIAQHIRGARVSNAGATGLSVEVTLPKAFSRKSPRIWRRASSESV